MKDRVKINLHDFDRDRESVSNGFREAAYDQGWNRVDVDTILARADNCSVSEMLRTLADHTEPDYTWDDEEDDWEHDEWSEEEDYDEYYISDYNDY